LLSSSGGLNNSANISFYSASYSGDYPSRFRWIYKGAVGTRCLDCYNFTNVSLDNGNIKFNISNFGNGVVGVGIAPASKSEVGLSTGWNMVSLDMNSSEVGDRNISISKGLNLIGLSGNSINHSSIRFVNSSGSDMSIATAAQRGYIQKQFGYWETDASTGLKRYKFAPKDGSTLSNMKGYWVQLNNGSGNLTLPNIGGSAAGLSYNLSDVMFRNASGVYKNITDANSAGWVLGNNSDVNQMVKYAYLSGGLLGWGNVLMENDPDTAACENCLNSWQGYFIYGLKDNITMLRQD
jgi:hypothetical protein